MAESKKEEEVVYESVRYNLRSNKKLFGVDLQESQSGENGSDYEKMQKIRKVADDDSVPSPEMRLFEVKVQESQVFHDALDMRERAISMIDDQKKKQVVEDDDMHLPIKKRLLRADIYEEVDDNGMVSISRNDQKQSSFLAPPPHKFHSRILKAIREHGGMKLPVFLFEKKLDAEDGGGCFKRLYLARYGQVFKGLNREESNKVYSSLTKEAAASLSVFATDPKGLDYEFHLNWDGVSVLASEWMRLVAANELREGDTLHACVYWLGNEFCLALIFQRAT